MTRNALQGMTLACIVALGLACATPSPVTAAERSPTKRSVVDSGRTVADYPGMDELLNFDFEGVTLRTPLADVPRILKKAGYTLNPQHRKYLLEFYRGDLTLHGSPAAGFSTKPGGKPGYVIRVQTDLELKSGAVKGIQFTRPIAPRFGEPFAQRLPDTLDVKLARDLKAILCRHIADERARWAACPPDTETRVQFVGTKQVYTKGAQQIRLTFNVTNEGGTVGLGVSP